MTVNHAVTHTLSLQDSTLRPRLGLAERLTTLSTRFPSRKLEVSSTLNCSTTVGQRNHSIKRNYRSSQVYQYIGPFFGVPCSDTPSTRSTGLSGSRQTQHRASPSGSSPELGGLGPGSPRRLTTCCRWTSSWDGGL